MSPAMQREPLYERTVNLEAALQQCLTAMAWFVRAPLNEFTPRAQVEQWNMAVAAAKAVLK